MKTPLSLTITQFDNPTTMNRTLKDGTVLPNQKRFYFTVTGNADALDQYRADIVAKTNGSGKVQPDGTVMFFAWDTVIGGKIGTIKRSDKGFWFMDKSHIATLNSTIEQIPAVAQEIAKMLWASTFQVSETAPKKEAVVDHEEDI